RLILQIPSVAIYPSRSHLDAQLQILGSSSSQLLWCADSGACEEVVKCVKRFGETEKDVAQCGCAAVQSLAADNDDNKRRLGDSDACEDVVKCLKRFGETEKDVAQYVWMWSC